MAEAANKVGEALLIGRSPEARDSEMTGGRYGSLENATLGITSITS